MSMGDMGMGDMGMCGMWICEMGICEMGICEIPMLRPGSVSGLDTMGIWELRIYG